MRTPTSLCFCGALVLALAVNDHAKQPDIVFMSPLESASADGQAPTYLKVADEETVNRYTRWLDNDPARMALRLHALAARIMIDRGSDGDPTQPYHIALVPQGNHASSGFVLQSESGEIEHGTLPYIKLDPNPRSFSTTFLHESGHVVLGLLSDAKGVPAEHMSSIPHTTSALTNRGTAFNEGYAIHLETLAAHLATDDETRARFHHESYRFGEPNLHRSEYLRHAIDLRTYSQDLARYTEVRENNYAFASAFREPEYLRVQLEKSRDFATLRNANQLLQSEGFYASFFFALTMRGEGVPDQTEIERRQGRIYKALAEMFATNDLNGHSPYLLLFVESYMKIFPDEAGQIADVLMDLSHGVFVDAQAPALWREYYLGALRLDILKLPMDEIADARTRWRDEVFADPAILYSRLGPQIPCLVSSETVLLVAFGQEAPVYFDINTVQQGIMRIVPGITDEAVHRWMEQRDNTPFENSDDFIARVGQGESWVSALNFP